MTMPKKGSRKITLDNVRYRWMVRFKENPHVHGNVTIAVQRDELSVSPLLVELKNVETVDQGVAALVIREAVRRGWNSARNAKAPFEMEYGALKKTYEALEEDGA